jgi:hypothetical protein
VISGAGKAEGSKQGRKQVTPPYSQFTGTSVPDVLWPDLVDEFGVDFNYHLAEGDAVRGLRGLLVEGLEGEASAPGRYARIWVDTRDLPRRPRRADWVELGDSSYDVETVDDSLASIPRLTIKLSGQTWLHHQ